MNAKLQAELGILSVSVLKPNTLGLSCLIVKLISRTSKLSTAMLNLELRRIDLRTQINPRDLLEKWLYRIALHCLVILHVESVFVQVYPGTYRERYSTEA